jgi:hypothetical protein
MRLKDGRAARATVVPMGDVISVVWFINDVVQGAEDYPDWASAVRRAGQVRQALRASVVGDNTRRT